ncbi:MAG: ABC transporter permease [Bacteroidales bacterium]|nr:ABC transporter permease [Bacteroidales bacterium]MBQ5856436.1 ABC transporter permease [Bacteroidales bacterium]
MTSYIIRKILYGLAVLWGVVTLVFFLFNIVPGDPVRMMLGQRADEADVQAIREELGLNQSVFKQYTDYLNDLSPISFYENENGERKYDNFKSYCVLAKIGDVDVVLKTPYLRYSYQSKRSVGTILSEAFPNTLILAFVAITFALVLGVFIGVLAAVVNTDFVNKLTLFITTIGMSLPSFFAAILVAWLFGYVWESFTGLSMTGNLYSVDDYGNGAYLDLKNLILPAFTLGLRPLAVVVELTRTSLLEAMSMDYIRTARAKGLKQWRVVTVHALRNAMTPVVTAISGWFASLLAGAVFVEYVFDWKGIGVIIVDALDTFDFPVIMGAVLLIGFMLIIINIVVDIIYGILDPRVRVY